MNTIARQPSCPAPTKAETSSMRSEKSNASSSLRRSSSKRRLESDSSSGSNNSSRRSRRTKRSDKKRRVTFEVDEKNRVKTHVRKIRRSHEISSKRGEEVLWWSQEELEAIMEREQNVFEVFSKCCTSYVDNVMKLWEHCETNSKDVERVMDMEKIANAPARGMENDVVVSFNPESRDKAIRSVMKMQRTMSKESHDVRTSKMRRRYRNLSRASAEFAKNIASGDARIAAAILSQ